MALQPACVSRPVHLSLVSHPKQVANLILEATGYPRS